MTANTLIERTLKTIGVLAAGETANGNDVADSFAILNGMIDTWATQRLTVYTTARTVFNLTSSTQDYTIGTGGTFDIVRPLWITAASVIPNRDATAEQRVELPITASMTVTQWQNVAIKGTTSTFPTEFYYDKDWTAGLAQISVWPIPRTSDAQLVLYTPTALVKFADRTTDYTFPPGYEEAMRYQLALRLGPEFGRPLNPELLALAMDTFGNIKRVNGSKETLSIDTALLVHGGRYNWRTDRYR